MSKPEKVAESKWKKECEREWPLCMVVKQAAFLFYGKRGRTDRFFLGPYRCISWKPSTPT